MTSINEEQHFNRLMELLHSKDDDSTEQMRKILEESLMKKYGHTRQLDNLKYKIDESTENKTPNTASQQQPPKRKSQEDSGRNDDLVNLLKDDLTCVMCRDMDVSAGNQLIECPGCHDLYHQECHNPYIADSELAGTNWLCYVCKHRARKAAKHAVTSSGSSRSGSSHSSSHSSSKSSNSGKVSSSKPYTTGSSSKGASNSSTVANSKSSSSSSSKSPSGSSSGGSSSGHSTSASKSQQSSQQTTSSSGGSNSQGHRVVVPNINIVSADKRLQIMKRKAAAKINEKRKVKNVP